MPQALAAVPLVLGQQAQIPVASSNPPQGVILSNASGFAVLVGSTSTAWLAPWTSDLFGVPANAATLDVTPTEALSPPGSTPVILPTLLSTQDTMPTGYPCSLSAEEVAAALDPGSSVGIDGNVPVFNAPATTLVTTDMPAVAIGYTTAGSTSTTAAVPAGFRYLVITLSTTANLIIRGNTTGLFYAYEQPVSGVSPGLVAIDPDTDPVYTITTAPTATLTSLRASVQPPLVVPQTLLWTGNGAIAGTAAGVSLVNTSVGAQFLWRIHRVDWIAALSTTTLQTARVQIMILGGAGWSNAGTITVYGPGTVSGTIEFPGDGQPLEVGGATLQVVGTSSATAIDNVALNVTGTAE